MTFEGSFGHGQFGAEPTYGIAFPICPLYIIQEDFLTQTPLPLEPALHGGSILNKKIIS